MTENEPAVEIKHLSKHFGNFKAVNDISFSIPQGEIFGLLGPNGAGKTTTIRILCGLLLPNGGSARVLGYDVTKKPEEVKKRIGYMSQKFSLYNDLSAYENISFYASIYQVPSSIRADRIQELLKLAGLEPHKKELTRNLSGAWRQRLALACAIVHDPMMIFLDEPTAGVDPLSRRDFWDVIYTMAGEGKSVLATTHYMDEADYCNTIGMMYQGELVALASPDEIKASLPGVLLQIDSLQPARLYEVILACPDVLNVTMHGVQVHATLPDMDHIDLLKQHIEAAGIDIRSMDVITPSLEDAFTTIVSDQRKISGTSDRRFTSAQE